MADQAALIIAQILNGLGYAHRAGIVHRDLKPANVMMSETGTVKIMDFGIARVLGAEHLTSDGTLMGTPAYMAPEQIIGSEIDARADLYSVGVLFYRLLTGCLPFQAETPIGIVHKQLWETAPSVRSQREDLPEWCEAILARALAKAPADRFQSAEEFRAALFTALGYTPGGLTAEALLSAPVQPPPSAVTPAGGLTPAEIAAAPTMTMVEHGSGPVQPPPSTLRNTSSWPPAPPDQPVAPATPPARQWFVFAASGLVIVALAVGGFALAARRSAPTQQTDVAAGAQASGVGTPATPDVATLAAPVPDAPPVSTDTPAPATPDARASNRPANPSASGRSPSSAASKPANSSSSSGISAPAPTVPAALDAAASTLEPSALPAAPATAAALALPPVTFRAQTVVVEDGKNRQRDTNVEMANGVITVTEKDNKLVTSIPYSAIVGLTYSNSKQPLWNTAQGPAEIAHLDGGAFGFLRGDQHWVSIRTDAMSLVWRVREQDSRRVILAIEERTGKKVDVVKER